MGAWSTSVSSPAPGGTWRHLAQGWRALAEGGPQLGSEDIVFCQPTAQHLLRAWPQAGCLVSLRKPKSSLEGSPLTAYPECECCVGASHSQPLLWG